MYLTFSAVALLVYFH